MNTVLTRLKEYIDAKGVSISAFEKSIGMSNASFGKSLKNGGKGIGSDNLEKILKIYEDLNPVWLLTGVGEMIKEPTPDEIVSAKEKLILQEQKELILLLKGMTNLQASLIKRLQEQVISLGGKPVE